MLERVISGGQTGADQAGWRAARAYGIPTGGAMPKGFLTEDGPRPEFAELYGAVELPTRELPGADRAERRGLGRDPLVRRLAQPRGQGDARRVPAQGKPFLIVYRGTTRPSQVRDWIVAKGIRTLNVAGNRETKAPGIGDRVERFLGAVFRRLGHRPVG